MNIEKFNLITLIANAAQFASLEDRLAEMSSEEELRQYCCGAFNTLIELVEIHSIESTLHLNFLSLALQCGMNIEKMREGAHGQVTLFETELKRRNNASSQANRPTKE